jgi:hypothetical protein
MMRLRFWLRLRTLSLSLFSAKIKSFITILDFFTIHYRPKYRGQAKTGAASFAHVGNAPIWCGSGSGSTSEHYSLSYIGKKFKFFTSIFDLVTIVYRLRIGGAKPEPDICINLSCPNHTVTMRHWFWLRLRPLFFCLYSEKVIIWYQFLLCSLYTVDLRIGVDTRTGSA